MGIAMLVKRKKNENIPAEIGVFNLSTAATIGYLQGCYEVPLEQAVIADLFSVLLPVFTTQTECTSALEGLMKNFAGLEG